MAKKSKKNSKIAFLQSVWFSIKIEKKYLLLTTLVLLLSYFQTLSMYFWNDDNAIIFKLQHLNEGMGNLGSGIFGFDSPYRLVIFPLIPVYNLFGLNSLAFFAYGIFFYFLAALSVFILAKTVLESDKKAWLVSLVFASGLVGAESLWRVYNSVHTSITIIFSVLFSAFYFYFIKTKTTKKKIFFYFLSIFFFISAVQWGYVRAHGIILIVISIELLFNFSWKYSVLRLVPFLSQFYLAYISGNTNTHHFKLLIVRLFNNYEFNLLEFPTQTLKNILVPDFLHLPLAVFIILSSILFIKFRSRIFIFCLVFIISGYLTYFVIYQDLALNTTHRYLTMALPGSSLLIVYILSKIFKSPRGLYFAAGIYIAINIVVINLIHYDILLNRSLPTKNFYQRLKVEIPKLNKNSLIYFDVENSEKSEKQFNDFFGVGSMPNETAIAIHYDIDRYDVYIPQTFDELIKKINEKNVSQENIYTFYFSEKQGLISTTEKTRLALFQEEKHYVYKTFADINHHSSSPLLIDYALETSMENTEKMGNQNINLDMYLEYFKNKENYYKLVEATSTSQWKYHEIDKLIDDDLRSSWMSHRVHWHFNSKDEIMLDLNQDIDVGGVRFHFGPLDKAPTKYVYSCSLDNLSWEDWEETKYFSPRSHGEIKIDTLDSKKCRYFRIIFLDTVKKDAPEIRELEVLSAEDEKLNLKLADEIISDPFKFAQSPLQLSSLVDFINNNGIQTKICFLTDSLDTIKESNCKKTKIHIGKGKYQIMMSPSGTMLKEIRIILPSNFKVKHESLSIKDLNYQSLKEIYEPD